jgi:colanic acid biosynthesis glycosyl transferase WcaI
MKIAIFPMFYPPTHGSGPVLMEELARYLAGCGHSVTIITTQPESGKFRKRFFNTHKDNNLKIIRTRTYLSERGPKRFVSWAHYSTNALFASLMDEKYDIVFLRSPPPNLAITGYILNRFKKIPVVFNVQDIHPDLAISSGILTNPLAIKIARKFEKWAYDKSNSILVISEGFKQNLAAKGVPTKKIKIIPNWVDTDFISPLPKSNPLSRLLKLDRSFVIMHAGSLTITSYKALAGLLDTCAELKKKDIVIALVGDGLCRGDLKEKANELKLSNVRFYPFQPQDDLPQLWASADVSVVALDPDKSESSVPSKLYNIMATGRPVLGLVNPASETASIIEGVDCGLVADPRDKKSVLKVVSRLKENKKLREELGANGRKEALKKYSREVVLREYEEFLRGIAESGKEVRIFR